jgi:hypothetical protein
VIPAKTIEPNVKGLKETFVIGRPLARLQRHQSGVMNQGQRQCRIFGGCDDIVAGS